MNEETKIIKFPNQEPCPYSLEDLAERVRELSKDSSNVFFLCQHAKDRKKSRNITIRQILDVLRNGEGVSGPTIDKYGHWRIKLKRYTSGRTVQVVVVFKNDHIEVVTVI